MAISKQFFGKDQWIFFDPEVIADVKPSFFSAPYWQQQERITGSSVGRGTTWFFKHQQRQFVLRHYLRGGLVGKINHDRYLFSGFEHSRSWCEFTLLQQLHQLGLPVPVPAAGRVVKRGLCYQADLIIGRIEQSSDLVAILQQHALQPSLWRQIGNVIAQFHLAGVEHTDLNAHNILIDAEHKVWIIDFDRGRLHAAKAKNKWVAWQQANLSRLQRSFEKECGRCENFYWSDSDWEALLAGYRNAMVAETAR